MNWLASLFPNNERSRDMRRGQAMSSTHDAFSLPTSSPTLASQNDGFQSNYANVGDPETGMNSPAFSYPPQGGSGYGFVSTPGPASRRSSLLPLHHDPLHSNLPPGTTYPPLAATWNRLRLWLQREYPELGDTLNFGILPQDLAQIEMQFGFGLPAVVRESYLITDGQEAESSAGCSEGLFFGLTLLPLEDVLDEWRFWREVDDDPATGANPRLREMMQSIPTGWIRKEYSQRGWIPLIADRAGNYVGVDLNPADGGKPGQVIVYGRDFDTKVVLWRGEGEAGWANWLASFVDELEAGEGFEIGNASDESSGDEDDIGYESYFNDGRGQGDGGGDSGVGGGLKMTGEYKGWSVLEAWADRSLRKWYEAGLVTDLVVPGEDKGKSPAREADVGLDIASQGSAAEPPHGLPTISVTKPPAPLPVDVPTPRDIVALPSPPDSTHSSFDEDDLELGRSPGIRGHEEESLVALGSPVPATPAMGTMSTALAAPEAPSIPITQSPSPPPENIDLLDDSAPDLDTAPITPSVTGSSPTTITPSQTLPDPIPASADEPPMPASDADVPEEDGEPDVTIRLVGGGGAAGTVQPEDEEEAQQLDDDAASFVSANEVEGAPAVDAQPADTKGHKKSKSSLASLKKLTNLGKRGSASSVKGSQDEASPSPAA
ncbi:hypothetical protein BD626DRAFT_498114 [Schizophyllum amplum]|uniref:Knr4/Smi1-like domain-containing protein n=1 Tax=Schizophyllum amplum TaxID=97359 RepID=A0A550CCZ5_9AGAR|nr:hypothetical protein BD626DRAFT_498114 [Auriculariopsis ampla]